DGVSPMADLRKKNGHEDSWDVAFFGVGNENWGCGGNMTPEFYGNEYRRYQTYVRDYKADKKIYKIACGANVDDYEWTERVLHTCFRHSQTFQHGFMDGLSLHYYTHPEGWDIKGSATDFDDRAWYKTLSKTLKMLLTPTYHVFNMYKYHQDAELLESHMDTKTIGVDDAYHVPNMTESVSVDTEGVMHLTITNLSLDEAYDVDALILEKPVTEVKGEILAEEMHAMNTFEEPENVKVKEFKNVKITDKGIAFTIPACSILHLAVK
ncbi:alpha-N-arabinofuranosidase, partial [Blautia pseudococcoides]|nr:alpha-N-arabinofuranosidase [Blautia pseudococcoides]